jgi:hypothetical protein
VFVRRFNLAYDPPKKLAGQSHARYMRGFKMMKSEGNTPRFMTSRTQLAIWGLGTFFMFVNAVMKFLLGQLFFAAVNIILACLWAVVVYRKATTPVFLFGEHSVDIYNRPIFSPKTIYYSDILCVEKKGESKFQLILRNAKPITLPLISLPANEREAVVSKITDCVPSPATGIDESVKVNAQQQESWF